MNAEWNEMAMKQGRQMLNLIDGRVCTLCSLCHSLLLFLVLVLALLHTYTAGTFSFSGLFFPSFLAFTIVLVLLISSASAPKVTWSASKAHKDASFRSLGESSSKDAEY